MLSTSAQVAILLERGAEKRRGVARALGKTGWVREGRKGVDELEREGKARNSESLQPIHLVEAGKGRRSGPLRG